MILEFIILQKFYVMKSYLEIERESKEILCKNNNLNAITFIKNCIKGIDIELMEHHEKSDYIKSLVLLAKYELDFYKCNKERKWLYEAVTDFATAANFQNSSRMHIIKDLDQLIFNATKLLTEDNCV